MSILEYFCSEYFGIRPYFLITKRFGNSGPRPSPPFVFTSAPGSPRKTISVVTTRDLLWGFCKELTLSCTFVLYCTITKVRISRPPALCGPYQPNGKRRWHSKELHLLETLRQRNDEHIVNFIKQPQQEPDFRDQQRWAHAEAVRKAAVISDSLIRTRSSTGIDVMQLVRYFPYSSMSFTDQLSLAAVSLGSRTETHFRADLSGQSHPGFCVYVSHYLWPKVLMQGIPPHATKLWMHAGPVTLDIGE